MGLSTQLVTPASPFLTRLPNLLMPGGRHREPHELPFGSGHVCTFPWLPLLSSLPGPAPVADTPQEATTPHSASTGVHEPGTQKGCPEVIARRSRLPAAGFAVGRSVCATRDENLCWIPHVSRSESCEAARFKEPWRRGAVQRPAGRGHFLPPPDCRVQLQAVAPTQARGHLLCPRNVVRVKRGRMPLTSPWGPS